MRFSLSSRAVDDYQRLSPTVRARVDKQLTLLLNDLQYPSLRAKKYDERRDIWQARITRGYRFYFQIDGDTYNILALVKHPD